MVAGAIMGRSGKARRLFANQLAQGVEPTIANRTLAVQVVGVQRTSVGDNPVLVITLQNISGKKVRSNNFADAVSKTDKVIKIFQNLAQPTQ